jgi:hypothetical protein
MESVTRQTPVARVPSGEVLKETPMHENSHGHEKRVGVRTRVSWGAIMAGAVVSIAVYLLMTLLGAAIGLSVRDASINEGLSTGAAIWAVITTAVALFTGGWLASQSVVGETKGEAVVHAIIMWGVVMAMIMWLVASGARAGFSAMIGFSQFADANGRSASVEDMRQRANTAVASTENGSQDPTARQVVLDRAKEATWWTLLGTLASMAAAVAGGFFGGGTSYRWLSHDVPRSATVSLPRGAGL